MLFPPQVPKIIAKGLDVLKKGEDDEAINYFVDLLPRIKAKYPQYPIFEFIQEPGETVFVPGGWWHGVLNLDHTVAVTQVKTIFDVYYAMLIMSHIYRTFALMRILMQCGVKLEQGERKWQLSGCEVYKKNTPFLELEPLN